MLGVSVSDQEIKRNRTLLAVSVLTQVSLHQVSSECFRVGGSGALVLLIMNLDDYVRIWSGL